MRILIVTLFSAVLLAIVSAAMASGPVRQRLEALGIDPGNLAGEKFAAFQLAEINRWRETIKKLGIKPE